MTFSAEDNTKLSKLLSEGLKRPFYWNKYKIISNKTYDENYHIRELVYSSYKELNDCLLLLTENVVVLIELQLILTEDTFFRELKLKITTSTLMKENFMINKLMN